MNRFEKLLKALCTKIEYVRELCPDIPAIVEAEAIRDEFARMVEILRDPTAAMNKRTVGFVASNAELAIVTLQRDERRFLLTLGTIGTMRERMENLHPFAHLRMQANNSITEFDILRSNPKTTTYALRQAYFELDELMKEAEAESNELNRLDTADRVRHTLSLTRSRKIRRVA